MEILKKACININDLSKEEKKCFIKHYNDKENVYILSNHKNIEYKILNIINNMIYLEFTGKVFI